MSSGSASPVSRREEAEIFVVEVLARKSGIRRDKIRLDSRLLHDLGLYGDDSEEAITEVGERFGLPVRSFDFDRYFFPEAFPFWMAPRFLVSKVAAHKAPCTVEMLVVSALDGRWVEAR